MVFRGEGFISIDCGIPDNTSYADPFTYRLVYVSDAGFTDAELNRNVNPRYNDPTKATRYTTVRYFPTGARNCYTLRPLAPASGKYLVRTTFYYGDYDGLNQLPVFDLHLGVNHWTTVNVTAAGRAYVFEVVVVPVGFAQKNTRSWL